MTAMNPLWIIYLLVWFFTSIASAGESPSSSPIQFCRQDETVSLDFCVAVTPYQNASSASTDLYITITRKSLSANGWLGVGLGSTMNGALMFILYDEAKDPSSAMMTSIRTAKGHHRPVELSAADFVEGQELPDLRVLRSSYDNQPTDTRTGTAHILVYSSPLWPQATIDPTSHSQPWVWAHNPTSPVNPDDGTFHMHSHVAQSGYGFFWSDFRTALLSNSDTPPPFPIPDKSAGSLHLTTETAPTIYRLGSPVIQGWLFHLHGLLASLAFLVLYPLGALLLRTSDPRAFNFHWTTQAFASVLLMLGAMLGWVLSRRIELVHQVVGMVVVGLVVGQLLLGWRHHMGYLRTKNGTWMGRWHVWIGRSLMGLGWLNVMLGLWARGYGGLTLLGGGLVILAEAGVMIRVLWFRKKIPVLPGNGRRCKAAQQWNASAQEGGHGLGVEYFELVGDDDVEEDDDYDEDGRLKTDVEWEEGRRTKMGDEEGKERATKLQKLDVV